MGGIAYVNAPKKPFGVADNRNYKSHYLFAHEFSHILGTQHDLATIAKQNETRYPPYYNLGKLIAGTRKHTIMAYFNQNLQLML